MDEKEGASREIEQVNGGVVIKCFLPELIVYHKTQLIHSLILQGNIWGHKAMV